MENRQYVLVLEVKDSEKWADDSIENVSSVVNSLLNAQDMSVRPLSEVLAC